MTVKCRSYVKRMRDPRAASASWSVPALCQAYGWPKGTAPGGGTIGIIELGGGWRASDMTSYFQSIGQPTPAITDISVDGTMNTPGQDADVEVALDIQVAGAAYFVAAGHPANIRVYWAQDIAQAVARAMADGCDVCSISWGADEAVWGPQAAQVMETTAAAAVHNGMVVFAAAGDNDAADGGTTPANVDVPASCPHVIGCGGTTKTDAVEFVWNNDPNPNDPTGEGTGGGYSTLFPVQSWQKGAPAPPPGLGRMVPDVAANADPNTGYQIFVGGSAGVVGGTSAVAPLFAGLFAAFGKKLGFVTPHLFAFPAGFNDITQGGNGLYQAAQGPDACTGMGSPRGAALAAALQPSQPAPAPTPPAPPGTQVTLAQVRGWLKSAFAQGTFFLTEDMAAAKADHAVVSNWPKGTP